MVRKVLEYAGFVENETYRETQFVKSPKTTYSIFLDSFHRYGADNINLITDHSYTIELYSYIPDPESEKKLETSLDFYGLEYEKDERTWIQNEQLYLTIYRFNHIEK